MEVLRHARTVRSRDVERTRFGFGKRTDRTYTCWTLGKYMLSRKVSPVVCSMETYIGIMAAQLRRQFELSHVGISVNVAGLVCFSDSRYHRVAG